MQARIEERSALTKGMVGTRVAHAWCMRDYAQGKRTRPRQSIVVVQSAGEGYGE